MMRKAGLYKKKATVVVSPSYSYDYLVGPLADHVFLQYLMGLSIFCVAVKVLDATRNVKTDSRSRIICWRTYSYISLRQNTKARFFRWHNYKLKHFSLEAIQLTTFEKYRKRKSDTDFCVLQRRGGRIAYFLSWLLNKKGLTSADFPKKETKVQVYLSWPYLYSGIKCRGSMFKIISLMWDVERRRPILLPSRFYRISSKFFTYYSNNSEDFINAAIT